MTGPKLNTLNMLQGLFRSLSCSVTEVHQYLTSCVQGVNFFMKCFVHDNIETTLIKNAIVVASFIVVRANQSLVMMIQLVFSPQKRTGMLNFMIFWYL